MRIDAIFAIERTINGAVPSKRHAVRDQMIRPFIDTLTAWLNEQRRTLSPKAETAKAMEYVSFGLQNFAAD